MRSSACSTRWCRRIRPLSWEAASSSMPRGDRTRMIENTTDDVATALFRFGGARGHIETSRISTGIRFNIGYDIVELDSEGNPL